MPECIHLHRWAALSPSTRELYTGFFYLELLGSIVPPPLQHLESCGGLPEGYICHFLDLVY